MFDGSQNGIAFSYNDTTGKITATVSTDPIFADKITFEGATPDDFETILQVVDPTADQTITLPNVTGTIITTGDSGTVTSTMIADGTIVDADINASAAIAATKILGTAITAADTGTVTNTMLAGSIANEKLTNSEITINGTSTSLGGTRTLVTDDIAEAATSPTNLWFTNERAQDAVATAISNGTQTNITITYDDTANSLSFNASGGVSSLTGTANEIEVSSSTGAVTIGLPNDITIAGNITINGTPSSSTHAATVGYVDSIAQGLDIKASVLVATTTNGTLTTAFSNGSVIDGITLTTNDRILIKDQTDQTANGIYIVQASGAPARSSDMNAGAEFPGAFTFVEQGSTNADRGFVCTNDSVIIGTTDIVFTQFSSGGSYLAGNGITLTGNSFSIDTAITADLSTAQTLTNKTLTSPNVSGLYISDAAIVIEGTANNNETTLLFTDPTADHTITFPDATGTVAFTADIETAVDNFGSAATGGTGITASYATTSNILTITNIGVTDITGTADEIYADASTGSVTLSLPQSIATTSSPSFTGLTVGSVTLTDALIGTATTSISTTSATVVDTWSATTYNSAKYIVQMKNGTDIEVLEVLVTVDGNNSVYITEYADVISNNQLGTTDADYSGGNIRLLVTSTSGTTVKVHKTLIEA
jgi:hypothetical protein